MWCNFGPFFSLFSLKDCSMAAAQWPVAHWLTPTSSFHVTCALAITRMTLQNDTYAQEKCVTDRNSGSAFALYCCSTLSCSVCIGCYFLASTTIERQHITSSIAINFVVYKQTNKKKLAEISISDVTKAILCRQVQLYAVMILYI